MSESIRVTSGDLRNASQQMRSTAQSVGDQLRQTMSRVQELSSVWTGSASTSFNGYYETFNSTWSQCEEALNQVATMLGNSAEAYEQTEQQISSQFQG